MNTETRLAVQQCAVTIMLPPRGREDRVFHVAGDALQIVGGDGGCKSGGPSKLPSRLRASRVSPSRLRVNKPPHSKMGKEPRRSDRADMGRSSAAPLQRRAQEHGPFEAPLEDRGKQGKPFEAQGKRE